LSIEEPLNLKASGAGYGAAASLWAGILLEYESERFFEAGEGAKAV
jgi:hypothetical protein